ncbi:sugar transferase [Bradyrhizobium sp. URHC0002]
MSYASFTNSPASTRLPAQSVADGRRVGKSRLTALLVVAESTEFLLVAVAAFSAAVLHHRQILLASPDAPKYIQESLLISTLPLLASTGFQRYSRIQTQPRHVFRWSGASGVFFVFSIFLSAMFLLKISEDYSRATVIAQAVGVLLTVLCTRAICFSLLQPGIASGLIDARRIISAFFRRHNVKPGITGWAQVNGYRGDTDTLEKMQCRVEHDRYDIDNWSLLLDLKIVVMALFSRKVYWNAY